MEYARFERTVNLLLLLALQSEDLPQDSELSVHGRIDELSDIAIILDLVRPMPIVKKTRKDGALSMPDAVIGLPGDRLPIVVDAKYYQTEIATSTIRKTLDDMLLRETPYGLLVCSERSGLATFNQMSS